MLRFFHRTDGPGWESLLALSEAGASFSYNFIVRTLIVAAVLPIFVSLGVLVFFIRPTGTSLVLHYNVYFGVDLLGIWWQAYMFPALSLALFAGHYFLAWHFYKKSERVASYLLLLASGFLSIGLLIASVSVAFINY